MRRVPPALRLLRVRPRAGAARAGPEVVRTARPVLDGPPPTLPAAVDRALERWWRLPPRLRAAAVLLAALAVAGGAVVRVGRSPYGPPVPVAVVARDLDVGTPLAGAVTAERRPAGLVPADAVAPAGVPPGATLAMGAVAGTVVTARHLRPGGPLADLPADHAAVAVPDDAVPGVAPGRRLDLIVTRADGGGAVVAADARVLAAADGLVWVAVPRAAAPDVAAAAARGLLSAALLPG